MIVKYRLQFPEAEISNQFVSSFLNAMILWPNYTILILDQEIMWISFCWLCNRLWQESKKGFCSQTRKRRIQLHRRSSIMHYRWQIDFFLVFAESAQWTLMLSLQKPHLQLEETPKFETCSQQSFYFLVCIPSSNFIIDLSWNCTIFPQQLQSVPFRPPHLLPSSTVEHSL